MKNDDSNIAINTGTLKSKMHCVPSVQETVFTLAAQPRLRRPYGLYGRKRRQRHNSITQQKQQSTKPQPSPSQVQGQRYEQLAISYLQAQGMVLIANNLRCKLGEIDCVMLHDQHLVFVEVRQRSHSFYGDATASISKQKQDKIKRTANYFLPKLGQQLKLRTIPSCRFDVISFNGNDLKPQWLSDAFR